MKYTWAISMHNSVFFDFKFSIISYNIILNKNFEIKKLVKMFVLRCDLLIAIIFYIV